MTPEGAALVWGIRSCEADPDCSVRWDRIQLMNEVLGYGLGSAVLVACTLWLAVTLARFIRAAIAGLLKAGGTSSAPPAPVGDAPQKSGAGAVGESDHVSTGRRRRGGARRRDGDVPD